MVLTGIEESETIFSMCWCGEMQVINGDRFERGNEEIGREG